MTNFVRVYYNPILIAICTDFLIVLKKALLLVRLKQKKSKDLSLHINYSKSRLLSVLIPALLLVFLSSCSSKKETISVKQTIAIDEIIVDAGDLTALQHVELAKNTDIDIAVRELLTATKLFYQESDYLNALWLADKTLPLIDEKTPNSVDEKVQLVLIKASCLQQLGDYSESYLQLIQLKKYVQQNQISLTASYYRLLQTAYQEQKQPVSALNAQLLAFSLIEASPQDIQQVESIWKNLQSLSQWQLNQIASDKAPDSKGWLNLITLANKFGANQEQMHYHLSMWQKKFKHHPANIIAKQLSTQVITPKTIENIAVIIPLTGKQKSAGLAIQQGTLASFSNDKTKKLHFIDSNNINWYGLTNELSILKIDYVIGPLLKKNVDKYITHTNSNNQAQNGYIFNTSPKLFDSNKANGQLTPSFNTPNDYTTAIDSDSVINSYLQPTDESKAIDTLLLNIPSKANFTNQHTVFSMRPEDEARQAAATLTRQHFKKPIVLSQKNIVSKRISQAFVTQWQRITGDIIDVVYYDTGTEMQANIQASLSVDKSKSRINTLKRRLNKNIKTQTRNRRDIDMIYLVGTPEQTRLVKPYIEVNISPFAEVLPVYASSRSHSTQSDYSTNSDLQGLTFTEIPWLLENEQNTDLAELSQQLWPKRSDGLSRLFAMGFDSYKLISKIPLMQQAPYLQHWGQTGVLKLSNNNILTRSLLWGTYKSNKVVSVAME